jgi:hypothetical protein
MPGLDGLEIDLHDASQIPALVVIEQPDVEEEEGG